MWKGMELYEGRRKMPIELMRDTVWPWLWRVRNVRTGEETDQLNLTRAKDAARIIAAGIGRQQRTGGATCVKTRRG